MQRQLDYLVAEYTQHKERMEQIGDPQYIADLKERLVSLTLKMKKLEKSKKHMEVAQKKKDKAILLKEEAEPETSQAVVELTAEMATLEQKAKEVDTKMAKQAAAIQDQYTKLCEGKQQWKTLAEEASGMSLDPALATNKESTKSGALARCDEAQAKKLALEKSIQLLKTRYAVNLGDYTQKKVQLQNQVNSMAETVLKKNE